LETFQTGFSGRLPESHFDPILANHAFFIGMLMKNADIATR
jgi:hypothetical protein